MKALTVAAVAIGLVASPQAWAKVDARMRSALPHETSIAQAIAATGFAGEIAVRVTPEVTTYEGSDLDLRGPWMSDPALVVTGQNEYTVQLQDCAAPLRVIEQQGALGKYRTRRFTISQSGVKADMATRQADFDYGDVASAQGPGYTLLSAAVCHIKMK